MLCCGDREKQEFLRKEQRWEYINLDDFKSTSCLAPFAYGWLWIMLAVSLSVYAVDTFTCINLILFDKWSGQIKPAIPFTIARWIFAGCIILSFVLLIYRWARAIRVMRQGGVAKCYLDPLAVRIQSIRMGQTGRGWKRFLVFAELTKSRKGADYVALFAHYSFEAWLRIVFAEGPRQVINAITLYSVMRAKLIPEGDHAAAHNTSPFIQFWKNVGILADQDRLQAVILFGMLWTVIIWVISAISLAVSVLLYLIFLWHHIPPNEGGLSAYCRNKINRRMERVVRATVDKALKKENELQSREEARAARKGVPIKKQPTLPNITPISESLPPLSRQTTLTTLPEYESRPGSTRDSNDGPPPLPASFIDGRPQPRRQMTQASDASWSSYTSNAPLLHQAAEPGQLPYDRVQTPGSTTSAPWSARALPQRSATGMSQFSDQSFTPGPRPTTATSMRGGPGPSSFQMEPLPRSGTAMSGAFRPGHPSGAPYPDETNGSYFPPVVDGGRSTPAFGPPSRAQTFQDAPLRPHPHQQQLVDRSLTSSAPPPPSRSFSSVRPSQGQPSDLGSMPPERSMNHSVPPSMRSYAPATLARAESPPGESYPPDRLLNYSVPPPTRTYTPAGAPPLRTRTPTAASSRVALARAESPPAEPPMSAAPPTHPVVSPNSSVRYQPFSPGAQSQTLPPASTAASATSGVYAAFNPQGGAPTTTVSEPRPAPPPTTSNQPGIQSFSRPRGPSQHTDGNRDSGVSDILNAY